MSTPQPTTEDLQKQLPQGAKITYWVEKTKGNYEVWYTMPGTPGTTQNRVLPGLTTYREELAPQFIRDIQATPSAAEVLRNAPPGQAIPITTEDVFWGAVTLASLSAPYLQRKFWPTPQQSYHQAMKGMSKKLYAETALEKAGIQKGASGEMWLNVQQPYETIQTQPREKFYRVTRGTPTTSMSKTLEAAIYGKAKGGLSAEQSLVPRSTWLTPPALKGLIMQPKIIPTSRLFPNLALGTLSLAGVRQTQKQGAMQKAMLQQSQIVSQVQLQMQRQAQQAQQVMRMIAPQIPRSITTTHTPWKPQLPKFNFPKQPRGKGLIGQWFRKQNPIKTPKQMMETFFGKPRNRGKRK